MKRLVMIFVLALWLPLGVGFADHGEDYDGSQDPETWFFDSILDENGNPFLDKHREYKGMSPDAFEALMDMNEKHFGCIKTEVQAEIELVSPPSYQLNAHLYTLMTRYYPPYKLQENRYLIFTSCKLHFCDSHSHYFIDTVSKHIAIITIFPADFFSKEKNEYGRPVSDLDNFYKYMFLLPDAPEEFIQKSLKFAKAKKHRTSRNPEIFVADCRKLDEVVQ